MLSVSSIVSGGFRLVKEHPAAVAVWGLVYVAVGAASTFALRPFFAMQRGAMTGDSALAMANAFSTFGRLILVELLIFIVLIIVFSASQRAVLRPQDSEFAYLRLGMDELRMIGLAFFLAVVFYIGAVILMVALIAIVGIFAYTASGSGGAAMMLVPLVSFLGILILAIWLEVRLSLSFPLTMLRGRITIGESWRLTRGRFWTLLGGYFVIALILLVLWMVVAGFTIGPYLAEMMRNGFKPEAMQSLSEQRVAEQMAPGPMTILGWILGGILGGLGIALFGGAVATAARELAGDETLAHEFE